MAEIRATTGGQLLVESLLAHGVTTTFGVPGESYLVVLDALHDAEDRLRFITCRQEGGASFMAEAWGKLTGQPGVCFVTRGPGATNASIGIHTARQNSSPMVLFVGQVGTTHRGREAFQEVDYLRFFGDLAKHVIEVADVDALSEAVAEAFLVAAGGRPGPVVVALPEDVLDATTRSEVTLPHAVAETAPTAREVGEVLDAIEASKRPLLLVGGGAWTDAARRHLTAFAAAGAIPVVTAFRFNDLVDNTHDCYAGEAGVGMPSAVRDTISRADTIVAIGVRFGEMTTDAWRLLEPPVPSAQIVHVHPDPDQLGRLYDTSIAIVARPAPTVAALAAGSLRSSPTRGAWRDERRAAFLDTLECPPQPGGIDLGEIMAWMRRHLPDDVIITNGAGNFTIWPNKLFLYGRDARLLAPQSGAMGYGLPAAIAATAAEPNRLVVCFAGDGDIQMTIQEMATAVQAGLAPVVLVIDNAMYGTIRMHQERRFPARVIGTDLHNPDFVAVARAYGWHSERVDRTADFAAAFARAVASPTAALLHLLVDPQMLTPRESIADARRR